jgi:hypothetical protein
MPKQFFDHDNSTELTQKLTFLREYVLRNGRDKGLREVVIQHLADKTNSIDSQDAIDYFNDLPAAFKTAYKGAWRQRQHKGKANKKKAVELTKSTTNTMDRIVQKICEAYPHALNLSVSKQREVALDLAEKALLSCLDDKNENSPFKIYAKGEFEPK